MKGTFLQQDISNFLKLRVPSLHFQKRVNMPISLMSRAEKLPQSWNTREEEKGMGRTWSLQ